MITGNRDYEADDDLAGLVDGLEQLARHLDAQHYPGRAWPVSAVRRRRPFAWPLVAPLAAVAVAAVVVAILVYHGRVPQSPMVPAPARRRDGSPIAQAPGEFGRSEKAGLPHRDSSRRGCRGCGLVLLHRHDGRRAGGLLRHEGLLQSPVRRAGAARAGIASGGSGKVRPEYQEPPVEKGRAGGNTIRPLRRHMMKRLLVLAAAMILASAANLWAEEKAAPGTPDSRECRQRGRRGCRPIRQGVWGGKSAAQWYIESIDKIVNLTDAQKKAITASIEARDKAMQEFQAKNAEKLKAAGTGHDGGLQEQGQGSHRQGAEGLPGPLRSRCTRP